jgi:hypothetical protein
MDALCYRPTVLSAWTELGYDEEQRFLCGPCYEIVIGKFIGQKSHVLNGIERFSLEGVSLRKQRLYSAYPRTAVAEAWKQFGTQRKVNVCRWKPLQGDLVCTVVNFRLI